MISGLPAGEELVQYWIQLLLRRIPRLEQVVVETDVVDRLDRDVGVGVRREQQQLGVGSLSPYLEFVIDSAEAGVEKPDPRIFRAATDRLSRSTVVSPMPRGG